MKLLLDGKQRNIYFRKDNTAYYKKNGIENDITDYFKKTGELKKTYSNLLVKSETVNDIKKKKITGGASFEIENIFDTITIEYSNNTTNLNIEDLKKELKKLISIVIFVKIQIDINNDKNPFNEGSDNYLKLISIILNNIFTVRTTNNVDYIVDFINKKSYQTLFELFTKIESLTIKEYNSKHNDNTAPYYGIISVLIENNITN